MSNHVKSVNSKRFHLRCFISSLMMLLSGAQINTEPEPPRFRQYDQDRDGVWSSGELSFLVLQATFLFNHHLRAPFGSTCFAVPKIQELRCKVWVVTFKMVMWRPWWKWNLALKKCITHHHTRSMYDMTRLLPCIIGVHITSILKIYGMLNTKVYCIGIVCVYVRNKRYGMDIGIPSCFKASNWYNFVAD